MKIVLSIADHTETIIVPVNTEVGPLTWSSMAITEGLLPLHLTLQPKIFWGHGLVVERDVTNSCASADYTETIPVPVPVSTESGPLSWSSLAITEGDLPQLIFPPFSTLT